MARQQFTQVVAEVIKSPNANLRVTQVVVEVARPFITNLCVTQVVVEVVTPYIAPPALSSAPQVMCIT